MHLGCQRGSCSFESDVFGDQWNSLSGHPKVSLLKSGEGIGSSGIFISFQWLSAKATSAGLFTELSILYSVIPLSVLIKLEEGVNHYSFLFVFYLKEKESWTMKYITMFCLLMAFALPMTAEAHTHLESSEPEAGGSLTSENPGITLTFDSNVQEPTALMVTDEEGEEFEIEDYTHSPENVVEFAIPEGVGSGNVEVFYSIIGEDGHVMEKSLEFVYEGKDEASETEEGTETEGSETTSGNSEDMKEDESEKQMEKESAEQQTEASNEESDSGGWVVPVIVFGILLTAIAVFFSLRKKV